jgi:hypothetical protein
MQASADQVVPRRAAVTARRAPLRLRGISGLRTDTVDGRAPAARAEVDWFFDLFDPVAWSDADAGWLTHGVDPGTWLDPREETLLPAMPVSDVYGEISSSRGKNDR